MKKWIIEQLEVTAILGVCAAIAWAVVVSGLWVLGVL